MAEKRDILREERDLLNEQFNILKRLESKNTDLTASQTQANEIQKDLNNTIRNQLKVNAGITKELERTEDTVANINKLKALEEQITEKIKNSTGRTAEIYLDSLSSVQDIGKALDKNLDTAKELDGAGGGFQQLANIIKSTGILQGLAGPFEDAAKASRNIAKDQLKSGKGTKGLSKFMDRTAGGAGAFASSLASAAKTAAFGPAGLVGIFGFIGKLITDIDKRSTAFAKSLGISKANAAAISKEFLNIQTGQSNLLIDADNLVDATTQLSENLGATAIQSASTLKNSIFLTKNLGLSAKNASSLSFLFDTFNQSSMGATNSVIELNKNLVSTNGFLIPTNKLLDEIAGTSAEIQGYFGFSAKELANAVYQTRRFGISLSAANNIAGSLLDFETSLSNELQLELMTNKALNFERARALAFTGDIAGASAAVLKQTQKLTEAQRRNPIILKAAAEASGLSVEELNKAFTIQKRLNLSSKAYNDLVAKGSSLVGFERTQALMLQSASREEFENNLSIQQKFQAATTRITQQFEKLIDTGVINDLIDGTVRFVTALTDGKGLFGAFRAFGKDKSSTPASIDAQDFTIKTHPKDTLVMSGGTKLGNETNVLLKELITAVKTGGDVYIDGAKVGSSLVMAKTKLS